MNVITKKDIQRLARPVGEPVVSIYLPTHKVGVNEHKQDQIRLKNLLNQAIKQLKEAGIAKPATYLAKALKLLNDEEFWRHQDHGLALFISPKGMRRYQLPVSFPEVCMVAKRYYIKPLLQFRDAGRHFYILTVSNNHVALHRATQFNMERVDAESLPGDIKEAIGESDNERLSQYGAVGGGSGGYFHGSGDAKDLEDATLERFLRAVHDGVMNELHESNAPLVFAGVDDMFGLYRAISNYNGLAEVHIPGNHDVTPLEELHVRALNIVNPQFKQIKQTALNTYRQLRGTQPQRAADELDAIIAAAQTGRVDTLLVTTEEPVWGHLEEGKISQPHNNQCVNCEDLVDLAAAHTLENSGEVHIIPQSDLAPAKAVAILRY